MNSLLSGMPIALGACAGLAYGCSFVLQQRGILFTRTLSVHPLHRVMFFIIRILILIGIGNYLLRSPFRASILATITFFSVFWLTIAVVKAQTYERN